MVKQHGLMVCESMDIYLNVVEESTLGVETWSKVLDYLRLVRSRMFFYFYFSLSRIPLPTLVVGVHGL